MPGTAVLDMFKKRLGALSRHSGAARFLSDPKRTGEKWFETLSEAVSDCG